MSTAHNILFLMLDQQRWDWLGYMGAEQVATPHIDALAAKGHIFTHCCTTAPTCAPARISLATGLSPMRFSTWSNHAYLPLSRPTYYQRLRDHGYRVGCVGKLDLAKPDAYNGLRGDRPLSYAWGFTDPCEVDGKMHAARWHQGRNRPNGPYSAWLQEQGLFQRFADDYARRAAAGSPGRSTWDSVLPTEAFADAFIGRHAVEWLRNVDNDFPWHYLVSFVGPHNPFDPPTSYADRFRNAPMPAAIPWSPDGKPARLARRPDKGCAAEEIVVARRQYTASIAAIDDQIGAILQVLDERGLRDNTIIVFTADHGEMLGDHGRWTKAVHYEGSVRIPLLVTGPGIAPGRSDALVELHDVNPTICELAGVPRLDPNDARSLLPLLSGHTQEHRETCFAVMPDALSLRTATHKLIFGNDGEHELYDLIADPQELDNRAQREPRLVAKLSRCLHDRHLEGGCRW
jgi:choline-sulfatase